VQPAAAYSSCQEYSSTRTVVVRSLWLVGQTFWYALSNDLRDPDFNIASFGRLLKTKFFSSTQCTNQSRIC